MAIVNVQYDGYRHIYISQRELEAIWEESGRHVGIWGALKDALAAENEGYEDQRVSRVLYVALRATEGLPRHRASEEAFRRAGLLKTAHQYGPRIEECKRAHPAGGAR